MKTKVPATQSKKTSKSLTVPASTNRLCNRIGALIQRDDEFKNRDLTVSILRYATTVGGQAVSSPRLVAIVCLNEFPNKGGS